MRLDCPHCHKSLEGQFIRWSKIQRKDNMRSCPHCGGEIEHLVHPEEMATRGLAVVVAIGVCAWLARGQGGVVKPLIVALAVLGAAYGIERYRLREAQRFRKGRN